MTVPVEPQMAWKQIISVVAVGMFSGFATSLVTTWYASKKQFYFWRWQQNISLCLEAYKAFRDLAEQYEKAMYQNPQQPLADDFRRKQLSVNGDLKIFFEGSAWSTFTPFDTLITRSSPPVSKLEAAKRQLDLAILLYFQDADQLSVHTLAGAAHGLLYNLLVARKGGESNVRPKERAVNPFLAEMIINAINFLKHADRDPDKVLTFNSDWTDFLVFDAIHMHAKLDLPDLPTAFQNKSNLIFLLWLSLKYPNVPLLDQFADTIGQGTLLAELKRIFPEYGGAIDKKKAFFLSALTTN